MSLSWTPNGLNELPEVRFEFLLILIGNQANHDAYSNSGAQVGAKNKDFSVVSQTELSRSLVPFLAQVANCCLRPSFWFSCTLVPRDCFCGAGYWSNPSSPSLPADVSLSAETDIAPTELARVIIWLSSYYLHFLYPKNPKLPSSQRR